MTAADFDTARGSLARGHGLRFASPGRAALASQDMPADVNQAVCQALVEIGDRMLGDRP